MDSRTKLFLASNPYDLEGTEKIFLDAVRDNVKFHQKNNRDYKRILDRCRYDPDCLGSIEDLADIPVIPTLYLKRHPACSVNRQSLATVVKSSGTDGIQSKIGIDRRSLLYGLIMAGKIFHFHGLISCVPVNYAILGYKPDRENMTGAARTLYGATHFAPAVHRAYALRQTGERYRPDITGFLKNLSCYEKAGLPVRLMGFPSYLHSLLSCLEENGKRFRFAPGSRVILGGGWKKHEKEQISKEELFGKTEKYLGIQEEKCCEFFSAVEHPIAYCSCKNHHFHVPAYSRVIVRDLDTLKPLPYGHPGLLNFVTPLLGSAPCASVMTDDIGILYEGGSCGCNIRSPYFKVLGRAGRTGIRTCAAQAAEHLEGRQGVKI